MSAAKPRFAESVLDLIGQTPMLRLARVGQNVPAQVFGKLERQNPGGSVKDRPALAMIEAAERSGHLVKGSTLVEATSGNTGISLAMIAAVKGYRCVLVMPEDMSRARQSILRSFGAELVLTTAAEGMGGAVERAETLAKETKGACLMRQFKNEANPLAHQTTTAQEILYAMEDNLDVFVAGVGTGGTLTGVARVLKVKAPKTHIVAVEPKGSPVLSGGLPGPHTIQGLGAGFVPDTLDPALIDQVVTVSDSAAERMVRRLAKEEGLLLGPSAGANVHAALEIAKSLEPGKRVVTILCDSGERYYV